MARPLSRSAPALATLLAASCLARAVHAQDKCDAPAQLGSVDAGFGADANHDGVPDDLAKRCALAGGTELTRDPWCYLSLPFVPPALAATKDNLGSFWKDAGCTPALAFPVDDRALGLGQGVVIVGASAATAAFVGEAIAQDAISWTAAFAPGLRAVDTAPPSSRALCLVSFDYSGAPKCAVAAASQPLASFYANYCPSGACNTHPSHGEAWPPDGLGLARSRSVEAWHARRPILASEFSDVSRFSFARGVLYSTAEQTTGCSAANAVAIDVSAMAAFDPTSGPPRFHQALRCPDAKHAGDGPALPPGVSLVPPALDAALRDDASARESAIDGTPPNLLEGVPYGLIADVRAGSGPVAAAQSALAEAYLLGTRALVATSAGAQASASFVVVPESIAMLDQHLVLAPRAQSFVVRALRPLAAAERAPQASSRHALRTTQAFAIGNGAVRTIEALESTSFARPAWPPRAATFDASQDFGTRWTSNDGPVDCFATTALAAPSDPWIRFAYPAASGASGEITAEYCPNELDGWLERTRPSREGSQPICQAADEATSEANERSVVISAVAKCISEGPKTDAGVSADAGVLALPNPDAGATRDAGTSDVEQCLRSGCDPLQPVTCPANPRCYDVFKRLSVPSDVIERCIANRALSDSEALLPAPQHWADVQDGDSTHLVAAVEMVRTTDTLSERSVPVAVQGSDAGAAAQGLVVLPTLVSHMTEQDAYFGGAHQTPDWNWVVSADQLAAIDPAYRGLAVINGRFINLENELEIGVPSALWDTHVWLPKDRKFNTHGVATLSSFLQSKHEAEKLGEIWPSDFCNRFGIARGGGDEHTAESSIPATQCEPCISCNPDAGAELGCHVGWRYFRTHLGRGIFSPITPDTVAGDASRQTAFMSTDPEWPRCQLGDPGAPEHVSLGLEDWGVCPHRVVFLGRPILDCGHGDDGCDTTHRLEIHPPHVITLEAHRKTFQDSGATCPDTAPCTQAEPTPGCTPGVVNAVFGWANVDTGRHLEFDLWPPPRPDGASALCVAGQDNDQSTQAFDMGVVEGLGFRIVKSPTQPACAAQAGTRAAPVLHCTKVPAGDPNHVHCTYDDPSAAACAGQDAKDPAARFTYGNPRMTPYYATSTFEARVFMGWGANCPRCDGDAPCDD
jgi:hypothetical protein